MNQVVTENKNLMKKVGTIVVIAVIVLAVVIVGANSFVSIPAGHTGVVLQFGAVSDTVFSEGLHVKIPFITQVVNMDNRVLKTEVNSASASKDLQTVNSTIALNYRIDPINSASLYQNVGVNFENVIVNPAVQECVKAVTAKFTAEELITQRQTVGEQMRTLLQEKISPYGLGIEVFNIIAFEFSDEFNAAIEAKQTAQQDALREEQNLKREEFIKEQTIVKAQAEAEAYRVKNREINKGTLAMEWINKWDGKLPTVAGDSQMMLNISDLLNSIPDTVPSSSDTYTPAPEPAPEDKAEVSSDASSSEPAN